MGTIAVTGGAGFIGSAIARTLLAESSGKVIVVDNFSTGREENLEQIRRQLDVIRLDVNDTAELTNALRGAEIVFHQAAIPSVPRSMDDPEYCHRANIDGAFSVFLAAHRAGVKRVVYAASSAAYGNNPTLPKQEHMTPEPMSPYAVQKLTGEHYAAVFASRFGLETVCLRYFNVFGPRQDPKSPYSGVLSLFIQAAIDEQAPTVFGNGEQSRDFIFVEDIARLNLLAAQAPGVSGQVFNAGTARRTSVNQAWDAVRKQFNLYLKPNYAPARPGDVMHSVADIAKANRAFGFEPQYTFEQGIERTVEWCRRGQLTSA